MIFTITIIIIRIIMIMMMIIILITTTRPTTQVTPTTSTSSLKHQPSLVPSFRRGLVIISYISWHIVIIGIIIVTSSWPRWWTASCSSSSHSSISLWQLLPHPGSTLCTSSLPSPSSSSLSPSPCWSPSWKPSINEKLHLGVCNIVGWGEKQIWLRRKLPGQ